MKRTKEIKPMSEWREARAPRESAKSENGFSMVELAIVLGVVACTLTLTFVMFGKALESARAQQESALSQNADTSCGFDWATAPEDATEARAHCGVPNAPQAARFPMTRFSR